MVGATVLHSRDFVLEDEHEWEAIIQESRPDYTPPDDQTFGLRNIHIFALSNILRRPIILLDRMTHISSVGDYAATFLPAFAPPDACTDPVTGELNKPIVIAWNSRCICIEINDLYSHSPSLSIATFHRKSICYISI